MVTKKDGRNFGRDYEADAALLALLASGARLQIVAALHAQPDGLSVTDLADWVNKWRQSPLSTSTVSSHLRRMVQAGLISRDRSQLPWVFYQLRPNALVAVRQVFDSYAEPSA